MAGTDRAHDSFFLESALPLADFCARLRDGLNLPDFELVRENEGLSTSAATLVHVSRADPLCPPGCNYSVEVAVLAGAPGDWDDAVRAGWRESWISALSELAEGGVQRALG
jgi:hypothetical protein